MQSSPAHKVKALERLDLQLNNQVYYTITTQSVAPPIKKAPSKTLSAWFYLSRRAELNRRPTDYESEPLSFLTSSIYVSY